MAIVPRAFAEPDKLAAEITRVEQMLRPDVVRIKHTIGNDWTDEPALFLKILLSDAASKPERLREVTSRVATIVSRQVDPLNAWGLVPYLRFRSQSEQAVLQEPAWT